MKPITHLIFEGHLAGQRLMADGSPRLSFDTGESSPGIFAALENGWLRKRRLLITIIPADENLEESNDDNE